MFIEKNLKIEKLGIMYLSACLKRLGHKTDLIQTDKENIDEKMKEFKPDFLAYSITTGEQNWAFKLNSILKKKYKFESIFGGSHCTFFPEDAEREGVDYWVMGQGEIAIIKVVEEIEINKIVKKPLIENINIIPFPDRELIYKYPEFRDNPMKNIVIMRDCPYSCSFCFTSNWRDIYKDEEYKFYQRRSVENIIDEIKQIKDKYPLEIVNINDDNFLPTGEWIDRFCRKYKKKIGLPFVCSISANLINEEIVKKLKDAGLQMVKFALETANEEIRKTLLNKAHITNKDIERTIELFKKYNIRFRIFNLIGLPMENSLENALETLEFNQQVQPTESWVSIFQPYPKLKLTEYAIENGYITREKVGQSSDNYWTGTQLNLKDKDKINNLSYWWHFLVKYPSLNEVRDILFSTSLSEELKQKLLNIRLEHSKTKLYGIKIK